MQVISQELPPHDPAVDVTVILVNWNGRDHLEVCIASLLKQSAAAELLLVDNASTDDSLALVRERFGDKVRIIELPENVGYGAGLNAGIAQSQGRFIFALNTDTEIAPACLATLVDCADRYPNCGSLAPKILSFQDPETIDNVGHLLYPDGLSRGRGRLEQDRGQYDSEEEILIASGCAMLMRRSMLGDVGLFDPDLFAYCEDTDLALRARLKGWRCRSVPSAVVYHKYSAATSPYSPEKAFLVERNRVWVSLKCLPAPMLALSPLFTAARLAAQGWGALTKRGAAGQFASNHSRSELFSILLRAWGAALRGLPKALRKRRQVQSARRISVLDTTEWMTTYRMGLTEIALKN